MVFMGAVLVSNNYPPPLLKVFAVHVVMFFCLMTVVIYALMPLPGTLAMILNKFQVNRIIGFYPFYLLGIMLKNKVLLNANKLKLSRILLIVVLVLYIGVCYFFFGFAYKSGFYLMPSSSVATIVQFLANYVFISIICVLLINSMPNQNFYLSRFGGRTLNVYLLHMIIVFPVCYGVFKKLDYTLCNVIMNTLSACLLCLVFFSKKCDTIMRRVLSNERWGIVAAFYILTLVMVNSSILTKFFFLWINC